MTIIGMILKQAEHTLTEHLLTFRSKSPSLFWLQARFHPIYSKWNRIFQNDTNKEVFSGQKQQKYGGMWGAAFTASGEFSKHLVKLSSPVVSMGCDGAKWQRSAGDKHRQRGNISQENVKFAKKKKASTVNKTMQTVLQSQRYLTETIARALPKITHTLHLLDVCLYLLWDTPHQWMLTETHGDPRL